MYLLSALQLPWKNEGTENEMNMLLRACKMAHKEEEFATNLDNQNLVFKNHMVEGEIDSCKLSHDLHIHVCTHT